MIIHFECSAFIKCNRLELKKVTLPQDINIQSCKMDTKYLCSTVALYIYMLPNHTLLTYQRPDIVTIGFLTTNKTTIVQHAQQVCKKWSLILSQIRIYIKIKSVHFWMPAMYPKMYQTILHMLLFYPLSITFIWCYRQGDWGWKKLNHPPEVTWSLAGLQLIVDPSTLRVLSK